jgi:hypothetical protein
MNCKLLPVVLAVMAVSALPAAGRAQDATATPEKAPQPVPQGGAKAWFEVTEQNLGTHFNHDTAIGHFPFKNPRAQPVAWKNLLGSCQCSKATITVGGKTFHFVTKPQPRITLITRSGDRETEDEVKQIDVASGETGEVEVQMDLGGVAGERQATLDIHTTDELTPQMRLTWRATGAQVFTISPADVNLNQMVWNEKRDFTVTVQSPLQRDFNITGYENTDKDFTVTYDKALSDGVATWTIHGNYAPHSADVVGGGVLKFTTDIQGQPALTVRVSAAIQGPLEVKPGAFMSLGLIRRGSVRTERVVFEPNDGTDLDAADIRLERLTMDPKFVTTHKSKDGKKLIVELEVSKDAPAGLLRGDLVVDLNHPAVKSKKILFNGFVR